MQVVAGRAITAADGPDSPRVIVLTEAAAQWFFQKPDPIGEQIRLGNGVYYVVGVVRDFKHLNLREAPRRLPSCLSGSRWTMCRV